MNKLRLTIISVVILVLAVVIVVKVFSPDEPEVKSRADSAARPERRRPEAVRPGFAADNATPEELFDVALSQSRAGCSSEMDYMVVIACCRAVLKKEPDSPYASKAEKLLQQMPKSHVTRYDRQLSSIRNSSPKVRKSKRLRRRTPARYRERFELDHAIMERLANTHR